MIAGSRTLAVLDVYFLEPEYVNHDKGMWTTASQPVTWVAVMPEVNSQAKLLKRSTRKIPMLAPFVWGCVVWDGDPLLDAVERFKYVRLDQA